MPGAVTSADMDSIGQLRAYAGTNFIKADIRDALSARSDRASQLAGSSAKQWPEHIRREQ